MTLSNLAKFSTMGARAALLRELSFLLKHLEVLTYFENLQLYDLTLPSTFSLPVMS